MKVEVRGADLDSAEDLVRGILERISGHRWLNLWVPHGFTALDVSAERRPSFFPEGNEHVRATTLLQLPVVFNVRNSRATTASRENLDRLRQWMEAECVGDFARLELVNWEVSPKDDPAPRKRDEADQVWQVVASFDLR
jgi:hypothetical protein